MFKENKTSILDYEEFSKIDRIRDAAFRVISDKGLVGSSVSAIAGRAGVSVGYLYRHYSSKDDLVDDLLGQTLHKVSTVLDGLIEVCDTYEDLLLCFIEYIDNEARNNPHKIKFLIMLENDFSFRMNKEVINRLEKLCGLIVQKESAYKKIPLDKIYISFIGIPLQYYMLYLREIFGVDDYSSETTVKRVLALSLSVLKE